MSGRGRRLVRPAAVVGTADKMAAMSLETWCGLTGAWRATYLLRGDPSFDGDSASDAAVTPMLGGRFVRIDYTWSDRARPQTGAMLIGFESTPGVVTTVWIDSWHNGPRMLVSTGAFDVGGAIDVRGAYPTGPGSPDWGWRTRLEATAASWTMTMFNIAPDGDETLAVRAEYVRVST
jgi:Protein of unknown function (DUF1579)